MKRFLILSILIAFVTVSCAGPSKMAWTKSDFRQEEFEKDSKECIEYVEENLDQYKLVSPYQSSELTKEWATESCLLRKGYEQGVTPPTSEIPKAIRIMDKVFFFMDFSGPPHRIDYTKPKKEHVEDGSWCKTDTSIEQLGQDYGECMKRGQEKSCMQSEGYTWMFHYYGMRCWQNE